MNKKVLLGLTTTPRSDWRGKIKEIERFKIKEIALFPTMLEIGERKELYDLLKKSRIEKIPHVHLRDDTESWELDYLHKKYKTHLFNIHYRDTDIKFLRNNHDYMNYIYVENLDIIDKNFGLAVKICRGVCFDASHFEDIVLTEEGKSVEKWIEFFRKYGIGCCHVSAIKEKKHIVTSLKTGKEKETYSDHYLNSLSELDYTSKYISYFPKYVSIELENSFEEQIEVKEYLEKIIN